MQWARVVRDNNGRATLPCNDITTESVIPCNPSLHDGCCTAWTYGRGILDGRYDKPPTVGPRSPSPRVL